MTTPDIELLYGHDPKRTNNFNMNFAHVNTEHFKIQQVKFWGSDSEQLYVKNLTEFSKDHPWRKWESIPITYSVNEQNYRCPSWHDIDWHQSVLLFGCSNVFGVGLDDSHTVSHHLETMIDAPVVNLGVSGSSPMLAWVNTTKLCKLEIIPKAVVYIWTYPERVTVLGNNGTVINCGAWNAELEPLSRGWIYHDSHGVEYLRQLIDSCSQQWKCPSYHYTICKNTQEHIPELEFLDKFDYARDRQHIGIETAKQWASVISSKLRNDL